MEFKLIYEKGVFRPLDPVTIPFPEGTILYLIFDEPFDPKSNEPLRAKLSLYP